MLPSPARREGGVTNVPVYFSFEAHFVVILSIAFLDVSNGMLANFIFIV